MAFTSSREMLDLELTNTDSRRLHPTTSSSHTFRDPFEEDELKDHDGNDQDKSDMRVCALSFERQWTYLANAISQRMGKPQQLRRKFEMVSTIGFTSCVMGT